MYKIFMYHKKVEKLVSLGYGMFTWRQSRFAVLIPEAFRTRLAKLSGACVVLGFLELYAKPTVTD
jgi:hypothetical protein